MAQTVKNLPVLQQTQVQFLGWDGSLEEGVATHSSVLVWRIPMDRGAWQATAHGITESDKTEQLSTAQHSLHMMTILLLIFHFGCFYLIFFSFSLAGLGLYCFVASKGCSLVAVHGLLIAVAFLLQSTASKALGLL